MSDQKTRNNHYVPQWYQRGFLAPNESQLVYLNLDPDRSQFAGGRFVGVLESPPSADVADQDGIEWNVRLADVLQQANASPGRECMFSASPTISRSPVSSAPLCARLQCVCRKSKVGHRLSVVDSRFRGGLVTRGTVGV